MTTQVKRDIFGKTRKEVAKRLERVKATEFAALIEYWQERLAWFDREIQ